MTQPPSLSTERTPQHTDPAALVPLGDLVAIHHTLAGAWGVIAQVECGCGDDTTCNVTRVYNEIGDALDQLTTQLCAVPDPMLAALDPEPAQWLAQLKSAVEDQERAEAAE